MPNWLQMLKDAEEARVALTQKRKNDAERRDDYNFLFEHFKKMKSHCAEADFARDELNKIIHKNKHDDRRVAYNYLLTIIVGIVGIIIAILLR